MNDRQLKELILAAKGKLPFDIYFYNARIVDVYRERVIDNGSVGVKNGIIAAVCSDFEPRATEFIDCRGMYLAPSFIDAHMHIESSKLTPFAYCEGAVPHGTGCVFFDPMQMSNTLGLKGIKAICEMLGEMPIESFLQLSSQYLSTLKTQDDITNVIKECGAKTVGEISGAVVGNEEIIRLLSAAKRAGVKVNGHCPSMGFGDVQQAACAGLCDDHECESISDLEQRLACGMAVLVREGTIEPNCRTLCKGIVENHIPTDNIMFCTDDKSAEDIKENGCIDNALRIAVKSGIDPVMAIKMATLNAARHYGVDDIIGSVAPSRKANFLLMDSLDDMTVKKVYHEGRLVAENGKLLCRHEFGIACYPELRNTVILPTGLDSHSFEIKAGFERGYVTANAIEMPEGGIVTRLVKGRLEVRDGIVCGDTKADILPIFVVERFGRSGEIGSGFIKGLGLKRGAVAASFAQESNNVVVSGVDPGDMLCAVKAVEANGGGAAVAIDGRVAGLYSLPVAGILSGENITDEIKAQKAFREALALTGGNAQRMTAVLTVSLCQTIPDVGLTEKGLFDVNEQRYIPTFTGGEEFEE